MNLYEGCENNDPRKGKCSRETWRWFWNRQSEIICESPPVLEVSESGVWKCYVCQARPSPTVGLKSCLICKSVYMCHLHGIELACLDNQAVDILDWRVFQLNFPISNPKQDFWQDVNNILSTTARPYCQAYGPDGVYRQMTPDNLISFARYDQNRRGGVLSSSVVYDKD
eukprot:1413432-Amphidinium_carterae.1